jgi:hypothetical protein
VPAGSAQLDAQASPAQDAYWRSRREACGPLSGRATDRPGTGCLTRRRQRPRRASQALRSAGCTSSPRQRALSPPTSTSAPLRLGDIVSRNSLPGPHCLLLDPAGRRLVALADAQPSGIAEPDRRRAACRHRSTEPSDRVLEITDSAWGPTLGRSRRGPSGSPSSPSGRGQRLRQGWQSRDLSRLNLRTPRIGPPGPARSGS